MLNASHELGEFDFIIIDEDCVSFLLEVQSLTAAHLAEWRAARRRLEQEAFVSSTASVTRLLGASPQDIEADAYAELERLAADHLPFDRLFDLLHATLVAYDAGQMQTRGRLMPLLRARAKASGLDVADLVAECVAQQPSTKFGRYDWEKPFKQGQRLTAPLRFAHDFLTLLETELDLPDGADTKLWLDPHPDGARVSVYLPRTHILRILNGTGTYHNHWGKAPTVLLLDATAGPEMRLALPDFVDVVLDVPQALHVIQTTNALYTAETLSQPRAVERVSRAIEATIARFGSTRPVVFSRKRFNPDFAEAGANVLDVRAAGLRYGHFARHNKGLNDYADADLLAIVGHFSPPLNDIEARVLALRGRREGIVHEATRGTRPEEQEKIVMGEEDNQSSSAPSSPYTFLSSDLLSSYPRLQSPTYTSYSLRRYEWRGADGRGLARWCRAHTDPDVQAAIAHATHANIWQTIGRGRAALRDADKPLVVLLLTAVPVTGLPVAELTDVNDIIGAQRITDAQRAALDAGRDAANAQRHANAITKIEAAKAELRAAGPLVASPRRVAELAGVARSTLWTYGYSDGGRWLRLGDMRDTYSLDVYISLHVCPAPTLAECFQHEPDVGGASVPRHTPPPDDYAPDSDPWGVP